jgi:hypothetical protein
MPDVELHKRLYEVRKDAFEEELNRVDFYDSGVPIRLSDERWVHIVEHHDDLAGHYSDVLEAVGFPDAVFEGDGGEFLAVSRRSGSNYLVVVYRELSPEDGFVITSFFTSRIRQIERRRLVWKKQSS